MGWAEGYFENGIMKQLGRVFRRCSVSDGYPSAEVIAAFPGYTPLTATFEWVPDPGSFLGKRVENWQYVCHAEFGVVVLSHAFSRTEWPQRELDAFFAREMRGQKIIIPVWHDLGFDDIKRYCFDVVFNARPEIFSKVTEVTYLLPPAWPTSPCELTDRDHSKSRFRLKELAWADIFVRAKVELTGQVEWVDISCHVKLQDVGPRL